MEKYILLKKIYLKKILFKKKICYYEILEINKPNIITLKEIVELYPKDENFWEELNKNYLNYCNSNTEYFNETKELYINLLEIKYELNEEIKNTKIAPRRSLLVPLFIWLLFLNNYFEKKELYKEYSETKDMLYEYIKEYKTKPNFA